MKKVLTIILTLILGVCVNAFVGIGLLSRFWHGGTSRGRSMSSLQREQSCLQHCSAFSR